MSGLYFMVGYSPRFVGAGPRACPVETARLERAGIVDKPGGHRTTRADTGVRPYRIGPALIDYRGGVRAGAGGWNG
ncbi:MAG: hypothetical protein SD837_19095 [Candidatus Electrothrix scaldis]|nr:MAG: hypothetical protein SD837_19095 [Candidatus Electrothrix sp. GW3-3]